MPVIVRWPGTAPKAASSSWPVTSTDLFPTILEAAGLPMLPEQHRDGQSFVSALKNPAATNTGRALFWHYPHWGNQGSIPGAAVRRGDWKLIRWFWRKQPELFNLATDPGETRNLAQENPEILAKLQQVIDGFAPPPVNVVRDLKARRRWGAFWLNWLAESGERWEASPPPHPAGETMADALLAWCRRT